MKLGQREEERPFGKRSFGKKIVRWYLKKGRHTLPWRNTKNPYHILVSEIMLQQTQVDRVIPKYRSFLKKFPTLALLAKASLEEVLQEWQGLGYNRRAKMLQGAAQAIVLRHSGVVPRSRRELEMLPGIGPYTAGAIRAFAYDEPDDFLETNIRTVLIHEFFLTKKQVVDKKLLALLPELRGAISPRLFYSALMDYGTYLKASGVRVNQRSAHYTKQKPFKGSLREVRGAVLRAMLKKQPIKELPFNKKHLKKAFQGLKKEGLIA